MATMTYTESAQLLRNTWFIERVNVCISTYSNYLLNTPVEDAEYEAKINAGTRIARENMMVSNTVMFTLTGDAEVQAAGPAIPDSQLQAIVEKTIKKFYPITSTPTMGTWTGAPMMPPPPRM